LTTARRVDHDRGDDERAVLIAGGGPTGLMLAGELALAASTSRSSSDARSGPRRIACRRLQSRTIEVLDQRGIADRFLAEGQVAQVAASRGSASTSATSPPAPYGLGLWQNTSSASSPAGSPSWRCRSIRTRGDRFAQDDAGVDVALSDGSSLRREYLVGCDGGRSLVRKAPASSSPGGIRRRAA
jgi:2-polyprenyl-6-methoxyphenol hydroxylase-like FAD-dependent oxidoreductase